MMNFCALLRKFAGLFLISSLCFHGSQAQAGSVRGIVPLNNATAVEQSSASRLLQGGFVEYKYLVLVGITLLSPAANVPESQKRALERLTQTFFRRLISSTYPLPYQDIEMLPFGRANFDVFILGIGFNTTVTFRPLGLIPSASEVATRMTQSVTQPLFEYEYLNDFVFQAGSFFEGAFNPFVIVETLATPPPTPAPTPVPTTQPPTPFPTPMPTPTEQLMPTISLQPSTQPSLSQEPSMNPTDRPSTSPSMSPSRQPSVSTAPSTNSAAPSTDPSSDPSMTPSRSPSMTPSMSPSRSPSMTPSRSPSSPPSRTPSISPSRFPSRMPSISPSMTPSISPSMSPSVIVADLVMVRIRYSFINAPGANFNEITNEQRINTENIITTFLDERYGQRYPTYVMGTSASSQDPAPPLGFQQRRDLNGYFWLQNMISGYEPGTTPSTDDLTFFLSNENSPLQGQYGILLQRVRDSAGPLSQLETLMVDTEPLPPIDRLTASRERGVPNMRESGNKQGARGYGN